MADAISTFSLPPTMTLGELKYTHPEYDPDKLTNYRAFVKGGSEFRDIVDEILDKRPIEQSNLPGAQELYTNRKLRARFIPLGAGVLHRYVASEYKEPITLTVTSDGTEPDSPPQAPPNADLGVQGPQQPQLLPTPVPIDPEISEFWENLSTDVDGQHTDLQQLFKKVSYEVKINGRGYFGVTYTGTGADQRPCIFSLPAVMVDDWRYEGNVLIYLRTHKTEQYASRGWGKPDRKKDTWVYYTATNITTYVYDREIDAKDKDEITVEQPTVPQKHDFLCVPIFPVQIDYFGWVMDAIFDTLVALYNRQASLTYCIDTMTYANLVIKLLAENPSVLNKCVSSDLGAIVLKAGEDLGYESPDFNIPVNAFKDEQRLKQEMLECLSAVPQQQAQQGQNARQGPTAKGMDQEPWHAQLSSLVAPVEDAFEQCIEAIKRNEDQEDVEIAINGLYEFGGSLEDIKDYVTGQDTTGDMQFAQAGLTPKQIAKILTYNRSADPFIQSQQDKVDSYGNRRTEDVPSND